MSYYNQSHIHLLWICETPFCGPEQLYKFHLHKYAKAIRPNLKVMLTGQGSDEFNGGYSTTLSPAENPSWEGFIESVNTMEMNRLHRLQGNIFRVWEEHFGLSPINLSYLKSNDSSQADPWQSYVLTNTVICKCIIAGMKIGSPRLIISKTVYRSWTIGLLNGFAEYLMDSVKTCYGISRYCENH